MYIYHALITALSTHMVHINLNTIFYIHVEQSYQNNLHKVLYGKNTHTQNHSEFEAVRHWSVCASTHTHTHIHKWANHSYTCCVSVPPSPLQVNVFTKTLKLKYAWYTHFVYCLFEMLPMRSTTWYYMSMKKITQCYRSMRSTTWCYTYEYRPKKSMIWWHSVWDKETRYAPF